MTLKGRETSGEEVSRETVRSGSPWSRAKSTRGSPPKQLCYGGTGKLGKTSKADPARGKGQGGIGNRYSDTGYFGKTLKDR
jgi:hypothetical protein